MMYKKQTKHKKFHNNRKWTMLICGMLCLFVTFWVYMPKDSDAAGSTSINYFGTPAGKFWYGKGIPAIADFWQELTVEPEIYSEGTIRTDKFVYDSEFDGNTSLNSRSFDNLNVFETADSTFSLKTVSGVSKAKSVSFIDGRERVIEDGSNAGTSSWKIGGDSSNPQNLWHDSVDAQRGYSSLSYYNSTIKTYYRTITDASDDRHDLGNELLYFYKHMDDTWKNDSDHGMYQGAKCFANSIVFEGDWPTEIWGIVDSFAKDWNLKLYTPGTKIPLQDSEGNPVVRIEMLTLRRSDFYGTNYIYRQENGSWLSSNHNYMDVDFLLHTSHNYEFEYTKKTELESPEAVTESGNTGNSLIVSENEALLLKDSELNPSDTILQYYLSNESLSEIKSGWINYNKDEPPVADGKKFLYIRTAPGDESSKNYCNSPMECVELEYREASIAKVITTPVSGGSLDVNQKISMMLDENTASPDACVILYSASETAPVFKKVTYAESKILKENFSGQTGNIFEFNQKKYIKLNDLWYECSDTKIEVYSENNQPMVGEELRTEGHKMFYVQVIEEGKELAHYQQLRYVYGLSEQTLPPQMTPATETENPTEVKMLDELKLTAEAGCEIFYTLNGNMPSYIADNGKLVAGSGTYKYETPIVVSESFAIYGKNFTVMAQAVTYNEDGLQTKSDSEVIRFTYKVLSQNTVASVTSVPVTSAEQPTEVQIGDCIKLYSKTEGVKIFYTLDGSEPHFDSLTGKSLSENTFEYTGKNGVLVPEPENSSQILITAVACKIGMATSEISRIIYVYPNAVAMPYATPGSGNVTEGTEVLLKTSSEDAVIYYEISHGKEAVKDPTETSQVFDAGAPIKILKDTKIKAIAVSKGMSSSVAYFEYKVSDKLSEPKASVETGAMVPTGTVINLSADKDAIIHYTLDGSDPKDSENKGVLVGSNVILTGDAGEVIVLRAYASKEGYSNSETANYSYSISAYEGGIYADVESGSVVKNGDVIILNTDMTEAEIYYTTDGTTPTEESNHGRTVTISGEPGENITVMAMAVAKGTEKSNSYAIFTYTIIDKLSAPTSSVPNGAIFTKESAVKLTAEAGRIYYTIDGTDPSTESMLYKDQIEIHGAVEIRAIAVSDDFEKSDVSVFTYGFAEQVAAPVASYASGELEMGTKVSFTSETEGATIYYRTDGKDINLNRKNELEIYKEPITINQPANFKVIAVKDKMQDSKVLKVGYTVKEPVVIESANEEETLRIDNQSNRLQSRRSFSESDSGPSYKDVVLKNASYGAVVAAEEGMLPEYVQLVVESTHVTDAVNRRVKQVISDSFGVVASYDVKLLVNGEESQPNGTIEIGLPIPSEYENSMIHIIHVQEDGNIELFETRRSGGMAYAKVNHLSVYSITAPVEFEEETSTFPWLPVMYSLAVGLTAIGIGLIYKAKKQRREEGMQDV